MSNEAYRIPAGIDFDDDKVLDAKNRVDASDLSTSDKGSVFRCAGCAVRGLKCLAVMRPVFPAGAKRLPYFRTDKNHGTHAADCPHDKKSKFKVVNCINRTGAGVVLDDLINGFARTRIVPPPPPGPAPGPGAIPPGGGAAPPAAAPGTRGIRTRKYDPGKLIEFLYHLTKNQKEGIRNYAGIPISQLLINRKTIGQFRNQLAGTGEWQIAILRKTNDWDSIRDSKTEFALRDAYSKKAEDDVYFVLRFKNYNTAHYVVEKIKKAKNDDVIAVIAKWERRDKDGKRVWWVSNDTLLDTAWVEIISEKNYPN